MFIRKNVTLSTCTMTSSSWCNGMDWIVFSFHNLQFYIIFLGKKAWDDVAEHSKEFIQEYLEEFPNVSLQLHCHLTFFNSNV